VRFINRFGPIVGVVILPLMGVFSEVQLNKPLHNLLKRVTGIQEITIDPKYAYVRRIEKLKPDLPEFGSVGFVTDEPGSFQRYALTQYGVAPLILEKKADIPYVIGSFIDLSFAKKVAQEKHFHLVKDMGDGVVLFKMKEAP